MFKGEFSINTARNCVCWLKKLSASFYKCLLFWTVLYILLMRYAWEVKRNRYWNCNYTFFFSNSCLIWRGGRKTNPNYPNRKGGVFLEHFELAINGLLWTKSQNCCLWWAETMSFFQESLSWGLELARAEVQNEILLLVLKFSMLFNVSMFLSQFGIFTLLISGPVWATVFLVFVSIHCVK